jgi:hypothetical protein
VPPAGHGVAPAQHLKPMAPQQKPLSQRLVGHCDGEVHAVMQLPCAKFPGMRPRSHT